ncbi:MAG: hypothetical protein EBX37_11490 [Alphaproteobacteria bacterium]|nr:hypothetical protein [Alphaproteobacteria bacterium]
MMQEHISEMRDSARKREEELDRQVTEVVKECQQVREQLMFQAQANNAKEKLLWAMISTLQTATQSLATRMELLVEERDRTVYKAKLENDKMKQQLRQEPRYRPPLARYAWRQWHCG